MTIPSIPAGQNFIATTATDPAHNTSEFSADIQIVQQQSPTTTTVTTSPNPSTSGQPVTITTHVSTPNGTPTGTVTFLDGNTVIGTAPLNPSDNATLTTSTLSIGNHTITATYGGDSNSLPSTSTATTLTVNGPVVSTGTVNGHTYTDTTGNGLSPDDTPLPNVTVQLYTDRNNNGVLDSGDGSAIATTISNSSGAYTFANIPNNTRVFITESVPDNYILTAPRDNVLHRLPRRRHDDQQ